MSTKRKWFLALAVVCGLYFLMVSFPSAQDIAIDGDQVWVVPGYSGTVVLDTGITRSVGNYWSGTVTLTLRKDGSTVSTGQTQQEQKWDDTITVKPTLLTDKPPLTIGVHASIPKSLPEGTRLTGTLQGEVVIPQYEHGGFQNLSTQVDRTVTVRVADQGEVTDRSPSTSDWPLPGWTTWVLWLPAVLFLLSTESIKNRLAARISR